MNILITSIGQRGYLIDHFRESARGEFGIYAADATKYAPALQKADKAFATDGERTQLFYEAITNM